jgi:hypothetical protein
MEEPMARRDKEYLLSCPYRSDCGKETRIILTVPASSTRRGRKQDKKIQLIRYCENCNRPIVINVPETWDGSDLYLGDAVAGSRNGITILQGERL